MTPGIAELPGTIETDGPLSFFFLKEIANIQGVRRERQTGTDFFVTNKNVIILLTLNCYT